jgi:GNAT superfamily N-acetyltransferase
VADFVVVDAGSDPAQRTVSRYFAEVLVRIDPALDVQRALAETATDLNPPYGLFAVARDERACGGVRFLDEERAEVKRMWVAPEARGEGVATALLGFLEDLVRSSGRRAVVLHTNQELAEAAALYEKQGYEHIPRYSDNPHAHFWFGKRL